MATAFDPIASADSQSPDRVFHPERFLVRTRNKPVALEKAVRRRPNLHGKNRPIWFYYINEAFQVWGTQKERSMLQTSKTLIICTAVFISVAALASDKNPASPTRTLVTIADARSGIAEKIDLGNPGDSPGDMFVFDQPLLDANHQVVGVNSGFCVRTLPGKFSECQWTLTLPNGTITVAGREAEKGTSIVPIVGGSGDYQSATGVLATTPNDNRTFTQVLTLHLKTN